MHDRATALTLTGSARQKGRLFAYALVLLSALICGCSSGRPPIPPGVIPEPQPLTVTEEQYGHQILNQLSEEYPLDYNNPRTNEVLDVVERLTKAAKAAHDPWHVYVFRDSTFKNAAATRGNHVFIWSAMLDATHTDGELAAVLAHEISHVLARHTDPDPNEELKKLLIGVGSMAAGIAVAQATGSYSMAGDLGNITTSVTQELGSGMLVYPYSRDREFEADQIGLFMMADAKFDPRAAIDFWTRAETDPSFSAGLAFFSTHPPAGDRLERLKALLPAALARYRGEVPPGPIELPVVGKTGGWPDASSTPPGAPAAAQSPLNSGSGLSGSNVSGNGAQSAGVPAEKDSFAVDPATVRRHERSGGQPGSHSTTPSGSRWIVVADKALLYRTPAADSKALGEFTVGARVQGQVLDATWIEINVPEHGFIKRETLDAEPR